MATIVTRSGKGSPLTNTEVDANFTNLNTGKAELSGAVFTGAITTNSTIDGRDVAADGVTADAALPKSGGAMTGAITTNSTFDGRDVATDGTKLDGIEASATADQTGAQIKTAYEAETNAFTDAQFTKLGGIEASATADQTAAEIRALVESATDSNVFTDADHTKLNGIEASADVTDTANVTAAGALMDSELTSIVAVKALNQGVATGDSPTFVDVTATSLDISGNIDVDGTTNLDVVDIDGDLTTSALIRTASVRSTYVDAAEDPTNSNLFATNASVGDFSQEAGHLVIQARVHATVYRDVIIAGGAGTAEPLLTVLGEGAVKIHNGGLNITNTAASHTVFNEGGVDADFRVESDGNANMLFVDGGNNRVGIGTNSPSGSFEVKGSGTSPIVYFGNGVDNAPNRQLAFSGGSSGLVWDLDATGASSVGGQLTFSTNGTERFRIASTGAATFSSIVTVDQGITADYFRNAADSTEFNLITRNNTGAALYVQKPVAGTILDVRTGNAGAGQGDAVFTVNHNEVVVNEGSTDVNFRVESNSNANMLFVDGGNDHVNIGTATDLGGNLNVNGGIVATSGTTFDPDTMSSGTIFLGNISDGSGWGANGIGWNIGGVGDTGAIGFAGNSTMYFATGDTSNANSFKTMMTLNQSQGAIFNEDSLATADFRVESDTEANAFTVDGETGQVGVGSRRGFRFGNASLQGNMGSSGGGYPTIGYNIRFQGTGGQFGTLVGDTSWRMDFGANNRLQVHSRSSSAVVTGAASYTAGPYVTLNGTSWTNGSDARLKENVSLITDAIDTVKAMRPVNYTWIHDGENAPNQIGFIAQEMALVVPEVVDVPETETDAITGDTLMWGIQYDGLVPVLTAALQEALTKIETLETRLTALENA